MVGHSIVQLGIYQRVSGNLRGAARLSALALRAVGQCACEVAASVTAVADSGRCFGSSIINQYLGMLP